MQNQRDQDIQQAALQSTHLEDDAQILYLDSSWTAECWKSRVIAYL